MVIGHAACIGADQAAGGLFSVTLCPGTTPTQPTLTLADIRRAFAELPLPTPTLVIQPPDGVTLVNFDTNFYTAHTAPLTRTVTLLGQRVTIRATPAAYTWTYGDGAARTTADPGAPYPDLRVTHRYERKGVYRTRLAVTYDGSYRVGQGGPWRAIPGRVTVAGAPQGLRAVEATPTLVGY